MCAEGGQLQLNALALAIGNCALNSLLTLTRAVERLSREDIKDDRERREDLVRGSISLITALLPGLGYKASSGRPLAEPHSVPEVVLNNKLLTQAQLDELLHL